MTDQPLPPAFEDEAETGNDNTGNTRNAGSKRPNWGCIIPVAIVIVVLALAGYFFGLPFLRGLELNQPQTETQEANAPTATLSLEEQVKATVDAMKSDAANDATATPRPTDRVNVADPTATGTPQAEPTLTASQYYEALVATFIEFAEKVEATPVPGAGPYEDESPVIPVVSLQEDEFDFLREMANAYRAVRIARGETPTLYGFVNTVLPGIYNEWGGAGKCSIKTDGGTWYNSNLEDCGGLTVEVRQGGSAFILAELNDTRVDNSDAKVTPFWPGSTMGKWGEWLASKPTTVYLTTGLLYVANDSNVIVTVGIK